MENIMASKTVTTPKNKAKVLALIDDGLSVREISRQESMPARKTIYQWISNDKDFSNRYARATTLRTDAKFDEIDDIVDGGAGDVALARLRYDACKWKLAKMQPEKYGEKLDIEHGGSVTVVHRTFHQPMPKDK